MNNELREKEISRDYHLKRVIIYSLIFTLSPFLTAGNAFLFAEVIHEKWKNKIDNDPNFLVKKAGKFFTLEEQQLQYKLNESREIKMEFATKVCWAGGIILELLITLLPLGLAIYHLYKFWKAYKACQKLVHPTLTAETATESEAERERERERAK